MLRHLLIALALGTSGCQRSQLTYATGAGSSAIEPVLREQALRNFSSLIDNPGAIPSHLAISSGIMQANSSITPSITFPFTSMIANAVSATATKTTTTAGTSSTVQGNYGFQLQFSILPITDIITLNNTRILYMAVICNSAQSDDEFPSCDGYRKAKGYLPPRIYNERNELILDPYYLTRPLCIRCPIDLDANNPPLASVADELPLAPAIGKQWLYWEYEGINNERRSTQRPNSSVFLGSSGGRRFYASSEAEFGNFLLATLPLPAAAPARTVIQKTPEPVHPRERPPSPPLFQSPAQQQRIPGSPEPSNQFRPFNLQGILPAPP